MNGSGYRVWLHEYPDGSGWADCFDWGNMYVLAGRDLFPGNLQVTTNSEPCSEDGDGNTSTALCATTNQLFAGYLAQSSTTQDECFQEAGTYTHLNTPIYVVINWWLARVWLHEDADNSGWADCFDDLRVSLVSGTRDANAGNYQLATNNSPC